MEVTETQGATVGCFEDEGKNKITWTITNTGSVATTAVDFKITTHDVGGYISSYKVGTADAITVPGNQETVSITISALASGESIEIEFEQHFDGLNPAQVGGCEAADMMFSYARGANSFTAKYDYEDSCAPVTIAGSMKGLSHVSNFSGEHLGELDIYGEPGTTTSSTIEYLFTGFDISHVGLNKDDQFVVTIDLTGDCFTLDAGSTFEGVSVDVDAINKKATIIFKYGTAPWTMGTDLKLTNKALNLPITLECGTLCTGGYKIGGELVKAGCTAPIMFQCNETTLNGYCEPGPCPDALQITSSSLERVSIGIGVDANGKPVPNTTATNANTRLFLEGDLLEISQTSTVKITTAQANFSKVRLEVAKSNELSATLVSNSGKVTLTRGGTDYPFTNFTVSETSSKYILEFDLTSQTPSTLQNGDTVKLSLQIKAGNGGNSLTHPLLKKFSVNSFLIY